MRLDELALAAPYARPPQAPAWTLGCFHRRCITFADGREDTSTRVIWIQSNGLTGDIRVPGSRPDVRRRQSLLACTREELAALAQAEGGVADTHWTEPFMRWSGWDAFQPYDKWPEPGELRRVGHSLIEWAPSGAYVEDWRLQPGSSGLRVGLRLLRENGRPRGGGIVVAGDHAILTLARREPLTDSRPLSAQVADAGDVLGCARRVFDAVTHYCRHSAGWGWTVALSTDPFAEGCALTPFDGFEVGPEPGLLTQRNDGVERVWRVDTLMVDGLAEVETPVSADGRRWLASVAGT
jgi:hypothetical protein